MSKRSVSHDTFVIERTYPASPARVFAAWATPAFKARWLHGPGEKGASNHKLDFRVGGRESMSGGDPAGPTYHADALYQDIVPDERIIYTYEMRLEDQRISVSVATVIIEPAGAGAKLTYTEQGVFLDGLDTAAQREQGTRQLLEQLAAALR